MTDLHYLPGCDVRKNHPDAVEKLQKYMISKGAMIDSCCRKEDYELSKNDLIISNCTLCNLMLQERFTGTEKMSLYEYVLNDSFFPFPDHTGETITVQDCYRTREYPEIQKAIRECLKRMHYTIVELEENFENTTFCGVWHYNQPAEDCVRLAPNTFKELNDDYIELLPPEIQERYMKDWVKQYTTKQVLVYCNGCEKGLKIGEIEPLHIIELLAENL